MFGINLGINPAEWFGEDRPDEQRAQNVENQERFAKNSIQWRVADAKAAGLHPLFGLSGGGSSFSPNPVTVGDGTNISVSPGEAIRQRNTQQALPTSELDKAEDARRERQAQNQHAETLSRIATDTAQQRLLNAQADIAAKQYRDSLGARATAVGAINKERTVAAPTPTNPADAFELEPRKIMPGNAMGSPVAAGPAAAGFEPIYIAPNLPALVPAGAAQNLGDMELIGWVASIAATAIWWGDAAASKVFDLARKAGHVISQSQVDSYARSRWNLPIDRRNSVHPH